MAPGSAEASDPDPIPFKRIPVWFPAVFRSTDSFGDPMYQLIILESTSPKILADFIGEVVEITGIEGEFYDWKTLKINTPSSIRPLTDTGNTNLSGALSMCR